MTRSPGSPRAQPFFLDTGSGPKFSLYHPAHGSCRGALVYVHPFAEEMNKSRRMAALQSRALAESGIAVLQLDLSGCGDSAGDFEDARLALWREDIKAGAAWLSQRLGRPVGMWGLRLGALLALDYARNTPECPYVLLWQPVQQGSSVLTQFLRLKVASELGGEPGAAGRSTRALRESLREGNVLEIAGYRLHPALADDLDSLEITALADTACPIHWFEVAGAATSLAPVSARIVAAIEAAGTAVHLQMVAGPTFWATQEIEEAPELVDATVRMFATASA
ncbi:hydrolase 2, exosortase A system-associated [Massilia sp. RP-1-19]|uniref:Hydrolase 2, exosortase A system-associated n=1 Tax=Massilia polaris TaxID=2728846 RepID=A0A848HFT8_9BURK|nr:hydrolase 2, exosortase A system-associated [Massilia polaris]NML60325.1 hydrolase 2, exosortase A system-associated [Massilia polaris]